MDIIKVAATWGKTFMGKIDNMTVVQVINNGTSTSIMIMDLIRSLFFICAQFNFECAAEHVPGLQNEGADAQEARLRNLEHCIPQLIRLRQ